MIKKKLELNGIKQVLSRFLFLLMSAQIVLGLLWTLCNLTSGGQFSETERYVEAAAGGALDEYMGVLYPVLIRVAQFITSPFGGHYEVALYLLQSGVALSCYIGFIRLCGWSGHRRKAVTGGLFLLTIPLCVQWHLAVLPNSLTSSLYVLLLGVVVSVCRRPEEAKEGVAGQLGALWALTILLMPDYLWLGALPVLFAAVCMIRAHIRQAREGKWQSGKVIAVLLAALLSVCINHLAQEPGSGGRIQKSLGASMVSRLVWPNFGTNYFFWPEEIKEIMTEEDGQVISQYADNVQLIFGPLVEGAYGREEADRLYWYMAIRCLNDRTKETLQALFEDLEAYLCPPWVVKEQLDGAGLSYSGWNYGQMRAAAPMLTKWYVNYGLFVFRVEIGISVLYGIIKLFCRKRGEKRRRSVTALFLFCFILQAVWYTMSGAGMMDYGNVCVVTILWYSAIWTVYHKLSGVNTNEKLDERV
ncbi:MAG: hypothetical protein IJZ34_00200 [Lachnospiraceae bacterium]|nr:hypothetical protein [Lachnospiraceae bacterium]